MNIDIKLKTYEQLQSEIIALNTNSYLKDLKIEKLQSNWNSLKEYLEEMKLNRRYDNDVERFTAYDDALDKMNELERKDNDD